MNVTTRPTELRHLVLSSHQLHTGLLGTMMTETLYT